ncbi:MAG: M20/M25/M40 family metallo-hydrolase [bacterium]|nr:M20/M25/M40 family metallo-hydrolase [bacterium]
MKKLSQVLMAIVLLTTSLSAQPHDLIQKINERELRANLEFLTSPELSGRDAPGLGSQIAERFIATRFEEYGLKSFSEDPGYYQKFPLVVSKADYENSRLIINIKGENKEFIPDKDVFFFPRGGSDADISGEVLLCGYGIKAPEFNYDDFAGADPKGKILLIFNKEPQENDSNSVFNGIKPTKYSIPQVKVRIAREVGAKGLLIVQPPNNNLPPIEKALANQRKLMHDPIVQLFENRESFPVFYLKDEAAAALLGTSIDLSAYQKSIDDKLQPHPSLLPDVSVTLKMRFKDVIDTTTANIVGYVPGQSDEAVLILAHHDHLGTIDGALYPGADDNASGTAGLLSLAKAFSHCKRSLKRSVIFLSTSAEEDGTLGAIFFGQHLPVPTEKIVAAINMDEIGRDGSSKFRAMQDSTIQGEKDLLMAFYSGQTPDLARFAEKANRENHLKLVVEPVLHFTGASDHVIFHDLKIPSVFMFTGFQKDYHNPTDTPDKIEYDKLTQVVRLVFSMAYDVTQAKQRLVFDTSIQDVKSTGRTYGY